jgi:hypothetical protein
MRLPHLVASARLYASAQPSHDGAAIALRADTLFIDGESQRCTVTWRGSFPLSGAAALSDLVLVAAGVHAPGQPLAWPAPPAPRRASRAQKLDMTASIDSTAVPASALPFHDTLDPQPSPIARVLPFQGAASPGGERAAAPAIAGAPWSGVPAARPVLEEPDDGGTMLLRAPGSDAPPALVPPPALVEPPALVAAPAPAPPPPPAPAPAPRIVQADAPAPEAPARPPPAARVALPRAAPAPPQPRPIEPVPRVPVPSAGSRSAYKKFGADD